MTTHHHPTHATHVAPTELPVALTGTWNVRFPRHIEQALEHSPALIRGIPGYHTYLVSDLAALYPVRDDSDPASGDLFDAAVMHLLHGGADLVCDVGELEDRLPDPVLDWLYSHRYEERLVWLAMLRAEIRMHQVGIMLGEIPRPHSPASFVALHIILEDAAVIFDVFCDDDEDLDEFEQMGGNDLYGNVLELVHDLLFADPVGQIFCERGFCGADDTLPAETSPLHPRNWFNSLAGSPNPWLERTV